MMSIHRFVEKNITSFQSDISIREAAAIFMRHQLDSAPVVNEKNEPVGIIRSKDFLLAYANGVDIDSPLSGILSKQFQTIHEAAPEETLFDYKNEIVLVHDDKGRLTGIIKANALKHIMGDGYLINNPYVKAILDNLHCGFLAVDNKKKVVLCNSFARKSLGITDDRPMIGDNISDFTPDEFLISVLQTGKNMECGIKKLNGRSIACSVFPIIKNTTVVGAIQLFQDVSDKESLAKELARIKLLNNELNGIIDSSYDGIVVTDINGKLLRISKSYSRISDIPFENLQKCIGNYVGDLEKTRESYRRGTPDDSLLVLSNQKPTSFSKRLFKGKELTYTGSPIFNDDGEVDRIVWNIRDMSEINTLKNEISKNKYIAARYYTELEELRSRIFETEGVIIHSHEMKKIVQMAMRVANVDTTVLITGETGVGKDVIAKIIHNASSRKKGPFIAVNCGAIPENLLESELFGYEAGAFTGANRKGKIGLFEAANCGTILLDEIGDLPIPLQVKILKVLQDQEVVRLGGLKTIELNIRILAATNKDLKTMVKENTFREDLFYRLNVIPISIPPLRERRPDIIPLVKNFIEKFCAKYDIQKELHHEAFEILENYTWPGNIRELENFVERILIISNDQLITPDYVLRYFESNKDSNQPPVMVNDLMPLKDAKEMLEMEILNKALSRGLSTRKVASILKVDHSTVVRKINKYKPTGNLITEKSHRFVQA